MEKVAKERGKTSKLRETQTINNWTNCEAEIFDSHHELEKNIINLCNDNNIILQPG